MARCPYCRKLANPLMLLLYSGILGYGCSACKGRSRLPRWGFLAMVVVLLAIVFLGGYVVAIRGLWVAVGAIGAWLVMWLCLPLRRMPGGAPEDDPGAGTSP